MKAYLQEIHKERPGKRMVEFGEKIKKLREEKGMTQQTMAEHLYVTRQAVSRWECGARYPDLLTTKKIAGLLEVTIDELVSGEELRTKIEEEPVLAAPFPNVMQSVLYTMGFAAYMLKCIFCLESLVPGQKQPGPPGTAGISVIAVGIMVGYGIHAVILLIGIRESVKNRLSPGKVGWLMSIGYFSRLILFFLEFMTMWVKKNGTLGTAGWLEPLYFLAAALVILWYFRADKRVTPIPVYLVGAVTLLEVVYGMMLGLRYFTELGFTVRTVHAMALGSLAVLLLYQAYVLDKKRNAAIR